MQNYDFNPKVFRKLDRILGIFVNIRKKIRNYIKYIIN